MQGAPSLMHMTTSCTLSMDGRAATFDHSTKQLMQQRNAINRTVTSTSNECESDDTVTMVMVVLLFLACNVLALVINVVENFFEPDPLLLNFMTDASNFLVILNSSVNFIIYMVFSKDFFELFW
jgi:hypothetical protein